jgi:hypothetical protein
MWNWFKLRRDPAPAQELARHRAAKRARRSRSEQPTQPTPMQTVEVSEGNTHADWSAWEDSMTKLDSQMGGLSASQRIYERESDSRFTRPSPLVEDTDAFGKVHKNREI